MLFIPNCLLLSSSEARQLQRPPPPPPPPPRAMTRAALRPLRRRRHGGHGGPEHHRPSGLDDLSGGQALDPGRPKPGDGQQLMRGRMRSLKIGRCESVLFFFESPPTLFRVGFEGKQNNNNDVAFSFFLGVEHSCQVGSDAIRSNSKFGWFPSDTDG